jgi:hypothetical protein
MALKYWLRNAAADDASASCAASGAIVTWPTPDGPGEGAD